MSLYIGKDNSSSNIMHFTSSNTTKEEMLGGLIAGITVFHSKYPLTTIIYSTTLQLPGFSSPYEIAYYELPAQANSYLALSTNHVFILIEGLDGVYRDCGSSGVFISISGSSYYISNTNSALAGKNALVVISNTYTYPPGSILISKDEITIGGIDFKSKKLLTINSIGTQPYKKYYPLEGSNILSLVDLGGALSVGLDNKSITYYDENGIKFEVISQTAANRLHTHTTGNVTGWVEEAGIYDGQAVVANLPQYIQDSGRRFLNITIPMSFYYSESYSRSGYNWTGLLRLSGYTDKSFTIDAKFFPYLRCRFEYISATRTVKARLYRQTDQVETYYTGVANPNIAYYTL